MENKTLHERLLEYYNISNEEFLCRKKLVDYRSFKDPFENSDFVKVVNKIKQSIQNKDNILIYGDYDVDGITSTTIFKGTILKLNGNVKTFIPNRYKEGYGLNKEIIDYAHQQNINLIICVDNGISKDEEIKYCKSLNIEVVIIDHHERLMENKLDNEYVFHQFESNFTSYNISAAFLSLLVSYGLLGYYDNYYICLAGLAVLSDCMPLKDMNLALLNNCISNLNEYKYKNLIYLIDGYSEDMIINYFQISVTIVSKLNSLGRMIENRSINKIVDYLLSDDIDFINNFIDKINKINSSKKEMVKNICSSIELPKSKYLLIVKDDIKIGLSGLLANRLLGDYDVVAVFSLNNEGIYVGSLRSETNYNLFTFLNNNNDILLSSGGHMQACGISLTKENMEIFKERFYKNISLCKEEDVVRKSIEFDDDMFCEESVKEIESFSPFGTDFEEPVISFKIKLDSLDLQKENNHLLYYVGKNKMVCLFNSLNKISKSISEIEEYCYKDLKYIKIYGRFISEYFRNIKQYKLIGNSYKLVK